MDSSKEHFFSITTTSKCAKSHVKKYQDGTAEGYEIICMDGSFRVHEYCFYNSEFLYNMLQGSDKPMNHSVLGIKSHTKNSHLQEFLSSEIRSRGVHTVYLTPKMSMIP